MRLTIHLEPEEFTALMLYAEHERRASKEQAALLVRQGLEQQGLLETRELPRAQPEQPTQ